MCVPVFLALGGGIPVVTVPNPRMEKFCMRRRAGSTSTTFQGRHGLSAPECALLLAGRRRTALPPTATVRVTAARTTREPEGGGHE